MGTWHNADGRMFVREEALKKVHAAAVERDVRPAEARVSGLTPEQWVTSALDRPACPAGTRLPPYAARTASGVVVFGDGVTLCLESPPAR